jgi:hypothetical protein
MIVATPPAIAPKMRGFRSLSSEDEKGGILGGLVGLAVGSKEGDGRLVGLAVGFKEGDGRLVGLAVGSKEGDGRGVSLTDGAKEGDFENTDVGPTEGVPEGLWLAVIAGAPVGMKDGTVDGVLKGFVLGIIDGTVVGTALGLGNDDGAASGEDSPPSRISTLRTDGNTAASRSKERNLTRPPVPRLNPVSTILTISALERVAAAVVVAT